MLLLESKLALSSCAHLRECDVVLEHLGGHEAALPVDFPRGVTDHGALVQDLVRDLKTTLVLG